MHSDGRVPGDRSAVGMLIVEARRDNMNPQLRYIIAEAGRFREVNTVTDAVVDEATTTLQPPWTRSDDILVNRLLRGPADNLEEEAVPALADRQHRRRRRRITSVSPLLSAPGSWPRTATTVFTSRRAHAGDQREGRCLVLASGQTLWTPSGYAGGGTPRGARLLDDVNAARCRQGRLLPRPGRSGGGDRSIAFASISQAAVDTDTSFCPDNQLRTLGCSGSRWTSSVGSTFSSAPAPTC